MDDRGGDAIDVTSPVREDEAIDLDGFLPYLFHLVAAGLNSRLLDRFRVYGVTVQRWRVLMAVVNTGPHSIGELVQSTLIPQSALSRVVDQMERDGLVERRTGLRDSRVVTVETTDHGRAMYRRLAPAARQHAGALVASFSDEEVRQLFAMLRRVLANLEVGPTPDEGTATGRAQTGGAGAGSTSKRRATRMRSRAKIRPGPAEADTSDR